MNHLRLASLLMACLGVVPATAAEGKRYAVVVGVRQYEHSKFPNLEFTENDAAELAKILKESGYDVELLCDREGKKNPAALPTKANIERRLDAVLNKGKRDDLVLIAFAGHGLQFEKDPDCYFCPSDAKPFADETKTLLSLDGLYRRLDKCGAGNKVLLADCCRNDPNATRGLKRNVPDDLADRTPPRGIYACFSCSRGQSAYEHKDLGIGHGVFFHHILEGLRGKASSEDDIGFLELITYVNRKVPQTIREKIGQGAEQTPNMKCDLSGAVTLVPRKAVGGVANPMPLRPVAEPKGSPLVVGKSPTTDKPDVGASVIISVQTDGFTDSEATTAHPDFGQIKTGTPGIIAAINDKSGTFQLTIDGQKVWVRQNRVAPKPVSKK